MLPPGFKRPDLRRRRASVLLCEPCEPRQLLTVAIGNTTVAPPDSGATVAKFTVSLSAANDQPVSVAFATADGSAQAGVAYLKTRGTLTFAPGETTKTVEVPVLANPAPPSNDMFFVLLENPVNDSLSLSQAVALATIGPAASSTTTNAAATASTPAPPSVTPAPPSVTPSTPAPSPFNPPPPPPPSTPAPTVALGAPTVALGAPKVAQVGPSTPVISSPPTATPPSTPAAVSVSPFVVTTNTDSGTGSLRAAILAADAASGTPTITFNLPAGALTIAPRSALPEITKPLTIDATTQPGWHGAPVVELNGALAGGQANGLVVSGGGSVVRGLTIDRFSGSGIVLQSAGGNRIEGDDIGTDAAGTNNIGNAWDGVLIDHSSRNTIGGTTSAARDVIAGNALVGVRIQGAGSTGNVVQGDLIGVDPTGARRPGNQTDGVFIDGAAGNTIGGAGPSARNVISGNNQAGVQISGVAASSNVVAGNFIGTDSGGGVNVGNLFDGVFIDNAPNNTIGGTALSQQNVISGNHLTGVRIAGVGAIGNLVQGDRIGTDATGLKALGNAFDGVYINGSARNTIGGATPGAGNLISANGSVGVQLESSRTAGNLIQGNLIGTDATGLAPLGNARDGVYMNGAVHNTLGGMSLAAGNVIAGNARAGIRFSGGGATDNAVQGNLIGTARGGGSGGTVHVSANKPRSGAQVAAAGQHATGTGKRSTATAQLLATTAVGPTVTSSRKTLAGGTATGIVLGFSRALDPARAEDVSNYTVSPIAAGGRVGAPVLVQSAKYDPVAQTVALVFTSVVAGNVPLQLTVNGSTSRGLTDTSGHFLAGARNGQAPGDVVAVVNSSR